MRSPPPDWSSEAGLYFTSDMRLGFHPNNEPNTGNHHNSLSQFPTPPQTSSVVFSMSGSFNDIRAACQSAQGRIMRLQQATNNQVGLTSTIREGWFDELRRIAQCFIAAQQASARLEQAVNTERAQLQGSLSSALNERDVRASERDAAEQEVKFLRGRLNELTNEMQEYRTGNNDNQATTGSARSRDSWAVTEFLPPNGNGPGQIEYLDNFSNENLPHLPNKVEDMPFSPRRIIGGPPGYINNSFSSAEQEHPTAPNQNQQLRSNTPHIASRGPRKQSKFFAKRGGAVMISRPPSGYASSSGKSTPDFVNGGPVRRFTQTPGPGNNGPFKAPPQPPFPQTQQFFGPGNNGHAHKRAASSFSSAENGTCPPNKSEPAVGSGPPPFLTKNGRSSAPRATMANSTRGQTPAPLSKELAIVRNDQERNGKFAAGVVHPSGGLDAVRVYDMFHFYNSIKDWVDKYCSVVNESAMHNMSRQHPRLWDYACTVTYPNNRHNASSHALYMLLNKPYRSFFISRLVIQFFVQQMWNSQAWEGMDEQLTDLLISVKHRLDFKYGYDAALQPHERHALVDKRSRAISDFINRPSWSKFQAQKVTYAMSRTKDILGPMLDLEKVDRDSADHELHIICEEGVELSTKLFTSPLSFQFIFNECGIKFSDQSHRPLNSSIPARELQAHHWRVMCVVTPGITYRNDAGVSVDPRFLAKANVLLMQ